MKLDTILIDDELLLLNGLEIMLKQNCPQVHVIAKCANANDAIIKIREMKPQLLLLDINMPGKSGLELLQEIDTSNILIIFITAHNNYAIDAFKYSAIDYLLKPIDEQELQIAVEKAIKKSSELHWKEGMDTLMHNLKSTTSLQEMKICIPSLNGFQVIELKDIIVCNAQGAYTSFELVGNKKILSSKPLLVYEQLLEANSFVRIHKSSLINIHHLKQYIKGEGGTVILSNNMEIEVSRRKKEHFLEVIKGTYKF
jgi:two-component system, LytTR family, response regulator